MIWLLNRSFVFIWRGLDVDDGSDGCMLVHVLHALKCSLLKRTLNWFRRTAWLWMCHLEAIGIACSTLQTGRAFLIFIYQIRILSILPHYFFKWWRLLLFVLKLKVVFFMQIEIDLFSQIAVPIPCWFWSVSESAKTSTPLFWINFEFAILVACRLVILLGCVIHLKWFMERRLRWLLIHLFSALEVPWVWFEPILNILVSLVFIVECSW